jgi:hypothetical protein
MLLRRWCNRRTYEMYLFGGGLVSCLNQIMCSVCFFATLALLLYGVDLTIALMKFFVVRYLPMRQFDEASLSLPGTGCRAGPELIRRGLRRDAFERYLYIKHFIRESSEIWGPFLVISWLTAAVIMAVSAVQAVLAQRNGVIDFTSHVYFVFGALTALYLMLLIAQTNTTVEIIRSAFVYSGLDDYALLGGRAEWVGYIDQAPIHWSVLGFVITPAWVGAFLSSATGLLVTMVCMPLLSDLLA